VSFPVGVFNQQIAQLYAELMEFDMMKNFVPILQIQIGYIIPERKFFEWDFDEKTDVNAFCSKISKAIIKYAYPFYKKYSTFDAIANAVIDGRYAWTKGRYYTPIVYYLYNKKEYGIKYIEDNKERFRDLRDPMFIEIYKKL